MKQYKASFTVEAVILMPILFITTIVLVYIAIFIYDRTIMMQDAESMVVNARNEKNGDKEKALCEDMFEEIEKEHPYISINNIGLSFFESESEKMIELRGDFNLPVWKSLNREIVAEKKLYSIDPTKIMYSVEIIKDFFGELNADSDDV